MIVEQSKFAVKNSDLKRDVAVLDKNNRLSVTTSGGERVAELQMPAKTVQAQEQMLARPQKDNWDKIAALAPIISAALIFLTGSYCTYTYNQEQIRIQQCQTIEKFIPHLMGNEQAKKAAILALSSLINTETASKFASIFASTGTVSALQSLSQNGSEKDKLIATQALASALQSLADREGKLSTIEQDYKKAIADKTATSADNRDSQTELAEDTLKRARDIENKEGFNAGSKTAANSGPESANKAPTAETNLLKQDSEKSPPLLQTGDGRAAELSGEPPRLENKSP